MVSGEAGRARPHGPLDTGKQSNATRLLDADDLAARWGVPRSQVYRLTRSGAVPAVKLGRYYRYDPAAIERFEAEGGCADG